MVRIALSEETIIELYRDDLSGKTAFKIVKELSRGSSMICYKAKQIGSDNNVILKEYYPLDESGFSMTLERDPVTQQLIAPPTIETAVENYKNAKEKVRQNNIDLQTSIHNCSNFDEDYANVLKTFIPEFTIYRGMVEEDDNDHWSGSFYQVIDQPELVTFEDYCRSIYKDKDYKDAEYKLLIVIRVIEQLAVCVKYLHEAGFCHRDICPHNFGFSKRDGDLLPETISLFDMGTFAKIGDDFIDFYKTKGYTAPEIIIGDRSKLHLYQADFYSIGACLFHAVCGDYNLLYNPDLNIDDILSSSPLIASSIINKNPILVATIKTILSKTLNSNPKKRYKNSDDLCADIVKARNMLLPETVNKKLTGGLKWELTKFEFDEEQQREFKYLMLFQLYKEPLYRYIRDDSNVFNISLVGFDIYSHEFLSAVLQFGQCISKDICVKVLCARDRYESANDYIDNRPGLKEYFEITIDGNRVNPKYVPNDEKYSYGSIIFENFDGDCPEFSTIKKGDYITDYAFISLGSSNKNKEYAASIVNQNMLGNPDAFVSYAVTDDVDNNDNKSIHPVFINQSHLKEDAEFIRITKMAAVRNLLHDRDIYINTEAKVKAYESSPYKTESCISGVLSQKYILNTIGVDIDGLRNENAIEDYLHKKEESRGRLIYLEHKRWVVDKLCGGWTQLKSLKKCADLCANKYVDKEKNIKQHVCVVRSSKDNLNNKLKTVFGSDYNKWDKGEDVVIGQMDDLDKVSVKLHREYKKAANKNNKEIDACLKDIRNIVLLDDETYKAFVDWDHCIRRLIDGGKNPVDVYRSLRDRFKKVAKSKFKKEYSGDLGEKIGKVEKSMYCCVEYNKFLNYKYEDEKIFDNLLFIYNYSLDIRLVKNLYTDNDRKQLFNSFADVIVAQPEKVYYCFYLQDDNSAKNIAKMLIDLCGLKEKLFVRSEICAEVFYVNDTVKVKYVSELKKHKTINNNYHRLTKTQEFSEERDIVISKLKSDNSSIPILEEGKDYTFDVNTRRFSKAPQLKYIEKHLPYLTVGSIVEESGFIHYDYDVPMYYENFDSLWELYCGDDISSGKWNVFCDNLTPVWNQDGSIPDDDKSGNLLFWHERVNAQNATFSPPSSYTVPLVCKEGVERVLEYLFQYNIIDNIPEIEVLSKKELMIKNLSICSKFKGDVETLLGNPSRLLVASALDFSFKPNSCRIGYKELRVSRSFSKADWKVINKLGEMTDCKLIDFIDKKGGFTCTSYESYDLLTKSGRLLEILVYYALKTSGLFDDVATSITIDQKDNANENGFARNELDIIVTKGFRCAVIECKASSKLEQEYYNKLKRNSDKLAIECTPVMITLCNREETNNRIISDNYKVKTIRSLGTDAYEFAVKVLNTLGWENA